jgi:hypothetical protein
MLLSRRAAFVSNSRSVTTGALASRRALIGVSLLSIALPAKALIPGLWGVEEAGPVAAFAARRPERLWTPHGHAQGRLIACVVAWAWQRAALPAVHQRRLDRGPPATGLRLQLVGFAPCATRRRGG